MPRRREIPKRDVPADPLYDSPLVSKFINCVMSDGKRSTAERILYKSFDIIKEKTGDDPLKVFKKAIDNVKPSLEVKSRRVGGSNYQVPVEVNPNRRLSLSIRWLVSYARSRGDGKTMQEKLANELLDPQVSLLGQSVDGSELEAGSVATQHLASSVDDRFVNASGDTMHGGLSFVGTKGFFANAELRLPLRARLERHQRHPPLVAGQEPGQVEPLADAVVREAEPRLDLGDLVRRRLALDLVQRRRRPPGRSQRAPGARRCPAIPQTDKRGVGQV